MIKQFMNRKIKNHVDLFVNTVPLFASLTPDSYKNGRQCYMAVHNTFPGCMSHGDSPDEAIEGLKDACRVYLEGLLEQGVELPEIPFSVSAGAFSSVNWQVLNEEPSESYSSKQVRIQSPSFVVAKECGVLGTDKCIAV